MAAMQIRWQSSPLTSISQAKVLIDLTGRPILRRFSSAAAK